MRYRSDITEVMSQRFIPRSVLFWILGHFLLLFTMMGFVSQVFHVMDELLPFLFPSICSKVLGLGNATNQHVGH